MEEFMLDYLREEFAAYSNELIIIGVLIIAFVSFYSRFFLKAAKRKTQLTVNSKAAERGLICIYVLFILARTILESATILRNPSKKSAHLNTPK